MIESAIYTDGTRSVRIGVDRIDTWLEDHESIINFPGVVELDGDRLFMTIHHGRHGGEEPTWAYLSDDAGATWRRLPNDFPLLSRDSRTGLINETHDSGVTGHLRDGSFVRINHSTEHALSVGYDRAHGPYHDQFQEDDPTFRFHRWTADATPVESFPFKVRGMPWNRASYQCYSRLLELDDGDFLTALEWVRIVPESEWQTLPNGRVRKTITSVFIVRSSDRGQSWDFVHAFDAHALKPVYGPADRPLDEGFNEADLVRLANGDLLCMFRTGSYSPMHMSRSEDGGRTWSTPVNVGWQGVKPRLELLPNGVLACAAGRGAYGHPQVTHVTLSLDGAGRHWEPPFAFHTGPGCSYTSTMQRDDRLHVVYSHSDFTRDMGANQLPSQTIRRAVLDVTVLDD